MYIVYTIYVCSLFKINLNWTTTITNLKNQIASEATEEILAKISVWCRIDTIGNNKKEWERKKGASAISSMDTVVQCIRFYKFLMECLCWQHKGSTHQLSLAIAIWKKDLELLVNNLMQFQNWQAHFGFVLLT